MDNIVSILHKFPFFVMITIREVTAEDIPFLLQIYAPYVSKTAISFEYDVPRIEEFTTRIQCIMQKYPFLVAEDGGIILGYAYAGEFKSREAFRWTVETSVYVDNSSRKKGIGTRLYIALEEKLKANGFQSMCACIAYTNDAEDPYLTNDSILFHEKQGFCLVAHFHRCGWKFSRWYDMVWMEKMIGEATDHPHP